MEDQQTRSGRPVVERDDSTSRLRRGWRLLAAVLPAVFPLLLAAISLGLWMGLGRTSEVSSAERVTTWLLVTVTLVLWLLAGALVHDLVPGIERAQNEALEEPRRVG